MKKLACFILIFISATFLYAQESQSGNEIVAIQKGAKTLGGTFAINERRNFFLRAGGGYFFTDRFALGSNITLESSGNNWNVEVLGRYYFPIVERTYVFLQAAVSIDNWDPIIFTIGPGISYFFNERIGIEGNLNNLGGGGVGMVFIFK